MPDNQRWWERAYRVDALYGLFGLASAVISGVATVVAALNSTSQSLTSWVWLVTFLGGTVAIALAFAIGGWAWRAWLSANSTRGPPQTTLQMNTKKTEYVQFRLPYTWDIGPGFKLKTLPADETGERNRAEEVHVFVLATQKMQNVQFEMRAQIQRGQHWETVAKIGSAKLTGTVHKEMRESFVVMRRTFRYVSTQYHDPFLGSQQKVIVRAEKDVIIFPDHPIAFPARIGDEYLFDIVIYHDDGPERAQFKLNPLSELNVPQTLFTWRQNIEFMLTRK